MNKTTMKNNIVVLFLLLAACSSVLPSLETLEELLEIALKAWENGTDLPADICIPQLNICIDKEDVEYAIDLLRFLIDRIKETPGLRTTDIGLLRYDPDLNRYVIENLEFVDLRGYPVEK